MEDHSFVIGSDEVNKRLDHYLTRQLSRSLSRSFIQKLIKDGQVKIDGSASKSHHKLRAGETVTVHIPPAFQPEAKPENIPLDIVHEDDQLVVVNKPAGMVVHPAAGNFSGTLVNALLYHSSDLSGIGGELKPGIVHRLDKHTSGLMVVAKTDQAHQALAEQFQSRKVNKSYWAVVKGNVALDQGIIEEPIGRNLRQRKKMAVVQAGGRSAITRYKVLERFKNFTLIEAVPLTGRTHQIRVHLSYFGHSVLGDIEYGHRSPLIDRQALHAAGLGIYHPTTGKYLEFTSEIPQDIKKVIEALAEK